MGFVKKRYFCAAVLVCFFLSGCATRERQNIGTYRERHEDIVLLPSDPELEEVRLIPREAPVKKPGGRYAYLTFDDGPSRNTNQILDILSDLQIKATFFVVGKEILDNDFLDVEETTAILQRILAEGHYLALHSMSHDQYHLYRSANAYQNFYNEMRELQNLLYKLTGGHETNLYRAPYGILGTFSRDHIRKMTGSGLKGWDWNIDTLDWRLRTVDAVLDKVRVDMRGNGNPNNAVILFHENNFSVTALPYVIDYFFNLGYTFVPYHPDNHFTMNRIHNPHL
jgi:peptidoglycan/xylan/chitin deacetylase (PgdA/CDA1 family)